MAAEHDGLGTSTIERRRKTESRSIDFRPTMVPIMIGKKAIRAPITILGSIPKPSQMMNRGPSATLGTAWVAMIQG